MPEGRSFSAFGRLSPACSAPSDSDGATLEIVSLRTRPKDVAARCAGSGLDVHRSHEASASLPDGMYCARLTRDGVLIGEPRWFLVHAGHRPAEGEADGLGRDALLVSEDRDRVRVRYAAREAVETTVRLRRVRKEAERTAPPPFSVMAHPARLRLQFCCNDTNPLAGPVGKTNRDSMKWLRASVSRRERRRARVHVAGYASTPGGCHANEWLSRWRARRVARSLRNAGFGHVKARWCGETGTADDVEPIDRGAYWQRVDVRFPEDHVAFRVQHTDEHRRALPIPEGTTVTVREGATKRTLCKTRAGAARQVDVVVAIDTSGSMADDWTEFIAPHIRGRLAEMTERFSAEGVDATVTVYTLGANLCGAVEATGGASDGRYRCLALTGMALRPCNQSEPNESWGSAISWISRNHPWRPGAARAVLPMSDELACEGDHSGGGYSDDLAAARGGARDARAAGVVVYPYFGTLSSSWGSSALVMEMMHDVAASTGGDALSLSSLADGPFERLHAALRGGVSKAATAVRLWCVGVPASEQVVVEVGVPGRAPWTVAGQLADFSYTAHRETEDTCRARRTCGPDDDAPVYGRPPPPREGLVVDCGSGR